MEEIKTAEQPSFELPEFEGQVPTGVLTNINGSGQRITRPLHNDSTVILVIEATVTSVNHKNVSGGLKRIQTLGVKDLYEIEGKDGIKLLSNMRLRAKQSDDERAGRLTIPGIEPKTNHGLTLDGSGVALTDDELAAAKGEDRKDELLDGNEPVVLVFSDKSRAKWPDDYVGTDYTVPFAGDIMTNPNNEDKVVAVQVVQVLDVADGSIIEEWTQEQEDQRLKDLEENASLKEKAESKKDKAVAKAKKKATAKKTAPKVIVDEITPALEADDEMILDVPGDEA